MGKTKRLVTLALFTSVALMLSFIESRIPAFVAIPGVKMGLANIATVFALYRLGVRDAIYISTLRVALSSLLFGSVSSFIYAIVGASLSLLAMVMVKWLTPLSSVSVSCIGGVVHNIGQVLAALLILRTDVVLYYLPALLLSGTVAGAVIGVAGGLLIKRINPREI